MKDSPIIKVCGMREPHNIETIATLPINFIGAIFYPKSPRYVGDRADSAESFYSLPTALQVVGVFVNASLKELQKATEQFNLSYLQLHGNESPEFCKEASKIAPIIKAFGLKDGFDFTELQKYEEVVEMFVFDTSTKGYGGSGQKFNWSILEQYQGKTPFLLSGGIGPDDVETIQNFSHPACIGLDLNSGFEDEPALKNYEKLKEFLERI